jgi:hypothetical protein
MNPLFLPIRGPAEGKKIKHAIELVRLQGLTLIRVCTYINILKMPQNIPHIHIET